MKRLLLLAMIPALFLGCNSIDSDRLVELKEVTFTMPEGWEVFYQARYDAEIMLPGTTDMNHLKLAARELSNPDQIDCDAFYSCYTVEVEGKSYGVYFTLGSVTPTEQELSELVLSAVASKD